MQFDPSSSSNWPRDHCPVVGGGKAGLGESWSWAHHLTGKAHSALRHYSCWIQSEGGEEVGLRCTPEEDQQQSSVHPETQEDGKESVVRVSIVICGYLIDLQDNNQLELSFLLETTFCTFSARIGEISSTWMHQPIFLHPHKRRRFWRGAAAVESTRRRFWKSSGLMM